jgi:hypothetical protein
LGGDDNFWLNGQSEIEAEKKRLQKTRPGENAEESDDDRKALEVIILKI